MCEAGEREQKTCQHLVDFIAKNGRCSYHEEITTGLAGLKSSNKMLMWIIGIGITIIFGIQSANLWFIVDHVSGGKDAKVQSKVDEKAGHVPPEAAYGIQRGSQVL